MHPAMRQVGSSLTRSAVLALTVLTGLAGLAYEVTWERYLAILLGSHAEAAAAVLGLFLGGLSLGYALFGALTRRLVARGLARWRPPRLLLAYGVVEGAVGAFALAFPVLFTGVQGLSVRIPHEAGGAGFLLDVALAALLVLPPAVLMGGTIPMLTQALARSLADATRVHAFIYAFNTAGAFVGALTTGFLLIPWLGLAGVMRTMGALHLGAGALFVALGLRRREVVDLGAGPPAPGAAPGVAPYAAVACLLGFAMMALQTTAIRLGGLAFSFAMLVAVFVLCIAVGSRHPPRAGCGPSGPRAGSPSASRRACSASARRRRTPSAGPTPSSPPGAGATR
jgi:spermidine synthase